MRKTMFRVCFTLILVTMVLGVSSVSAKETTWKMTSAFSAGTVVALLADAMDEKFTKLVNLLCKGKLHIDFFPGGAIVPAFEIFDACRNNTVQAAGDWPGYWAGKDIAFFLTVSRKTWL